MAKSSDSEYEMMLDKRSKWNQDGPTISLIDDSSFLGARWKMLLFFCAGITAVVAHHCLYAFLHGKAVDDGPLSPFQSMFRTSMSDQALASALGNAIATIAKLCLAGAVATAFVQLFWWRMRRKGCTIRQVDKVMSYESNPANFMTWSAWVHTFWLSAVATSASLLVVITIAAPGSLTVETMSVLTPCTVSTVNLETSDLTGILPLQNGDPPYYIYGNPSGKTFSFVSQVLMMGTYIEPTSPCGVCEYNISFVAPAVQCEDISNTVNFAEMLPPYTSAGAVVWNTTQPFDGSAIPPYHLYVASRNLPGTSAKDLPSSNFSEFPAQALDCLGYSATYHVLVQHNLTTTMVVTGMDMGDGLTQVNATSLSQFQLMTIWDAFGKQLTGTVTYLPTYNDFNPPVAFMAYSPFVSASKDIAWQWKTNMSVAIPSIMQNVSLSLLSDQLSTEQNSTLKQVDITCLTTGLHFVYNRLRLLLIYASSAVLTAFCIAFGLFAASANGVSESMAFSRIVGSSFVLKDRMDSRQMTLLSRDTRIVAENDGTLSL